MGAGDAMSDEDGDAHRMIGDALERLLAEQWHRARFADLEARRTMQHRLWDQLIGAGMLAPWLPESLGGGGLGVAAIVPMAQACGRHLVRLPLLGNVVMGGAALVAVGDERFPLGGGGSRCALAVAEQGQSYGRALGNDARGETRATPDTRGWRLDGTKAFVLDAEDATCLLVSARIDVDGFGDSALFMVDPAARGVEISAYDSVEGSRLATVTFDAARCASDALLTHGPLARAALEQSWLHGCLWAAAETLGACDAAFEQTIAYLRVREQFGRRLAEFQALQHRAADLFAELELLRSQVAGAGAALAAMAERTGTESRATGQSVAQASAPVRLQVAAAATLAAEVGRRVTRDAIHLHGAIGMTEDLGIGRYLMRVDFLWQLLGGPSEQRELIVESLSEAMEASEA